MSREGVHELVTLSKIVATPVEITLSRALPVPVSVAYPWLTDIQDSDVERAGAVVKGRRVRSRSEDGLVYEGETSVLGQKIWSVTQVTFRPPDRWEARVVEGPRTGSSTDYRLVDTPEGSQLTVVYRFVLADRRRMFFLRLLKVLVRRELAKMWDGFEADLRREFKAPERA